MTITKDQIIKDIANSEGCTTKDARSTYNALESLIFEYLSTTTPENDAANPITIRLFEGISIEGTYQPEKKKKLNYINSDDNNFITVKGGIKAKAKITRNYLRKLNAS